MCELFGNGIILVGIQFRVDEKTIQRSYAGNNNIWPVQTVIPTGNIDVQNGVAVLLETSGK